MNCILRQETVSANTTKYTQTDASVYLASKRDGDDYFIVNIKGVCIRIPMALYLSSLNNVDEDFNSYNESEPEVHLDIFSDKIESRVTSIKDNRKQEFITQLDNQIEKKYSDNSFKIAELASLMAVCERQLRRKVNNFVDMSPAEYVRNFRLKKAILLLEQGKTANFVSYEVGFSSQSHFGKCFSELVGCSPSKYKSSKAKYAKH